jgi:hypothetical protein
MFIGRYDFDGHVPDLLAAYDRLMLEVPAEGIHFHACVSHAGGITIYDCCPTREVFESFSTSWWFEEAARAAGLPPARVTAIGDVHAARVGETFFH